MLIGISQRHQLQNSRFIGVKIARVILELPNLSFAITLAIDIFEEVSEMNE